jgi:hypothetical protein
VLRDVQRLYSEIGAAMTTGLEGRIEDQRSGYAPRANSPEARNQAEFERQINLAYEIAKSRENPEGKASSVSNSDDKPVNNNLTATGIREGFSHYHKPCPYSHVDVYRVLKLFGVTDPCLQHAIKKLLVAGGRGQKDITRDVQEAVVTLTRWQQMQEEEKAKEPSRD